MADIVIIPAAGSGRRMGAAVNKQYLLLDGVPILAHTLQLFENHPRIDRIVVVSPADELDYCRSTIIDRYGFTKVTALVAGGAERQDSVWNGLLASGGADGDRVLIHDGARPFLPPAVIDAALAAIDSYGACAVGVPVKDTIKRVIDSIAVETPDRRHLWQVQTPQGFRFGLIVAAHRAARECGFTGTDDAMLVERLGRPVVMVEGSYANIKITTPDDLIIGQALLMRQKGTA